MAEPTSSISFYDRLWGLAEKIFETVWHSDGNHDVWHWIVLLLIVSIALGVLSIVSLKTLGKVVEHLIKLVEAYKASGLPMLLSQDNKSRVRRRKQFCGVLDADLSYLAKAENWNDQYFTDLEAEVETEGGYYASAWHRMRRRKSFGLRKEKSLIRAISSSTERAMQLVGEPGSGKSVALRHLAKQFAEQGKKSNDKSAIVPLYVNLREMETDNMDVVTANNVREFVLDNIRRGDSDTTAFVKENWDDYCDKGIWLFLFDSFDEIPAVLHAEAGSNVVRQYSQAIRQFLEGMGECKGILASREFKGPEALPWKTVRILPLSGIKQDELIQNSFLDAKQMSLVRQHLATSDSSIGATPLFLTLLCRYIKDEQKAPNNDHDILLQHVERLARRDPEYLKRKYNFSVDELIYGAERLAQLFAEDENLSLAPTLDQIIAHLPKSRIPEGEIERLVSALVDCKIGRADVPNAAQGDRRFAFAHRRYQEALFVRYLSSHPKAIPAYDLLTEPRWREYTVTLLQTREHSEIQQLLETACQILDERAALQMDSAEIAPVNAPHSCFFSWNNEMAVPLLMLLQEGLSRRLQDVPALLSQAIYKFLKPRWHSGDTLDRCEVLRLGGLLPNDILVQYLAESFASGTKGEREQAFKQAVFAPILPEKSRASVLEMLSDEVLLAHDRADQLRVEALAARLPLNMGASFVVSRCERMRRKLQILQKFGSVFGIIFPLQLAEQSAEWLLGVRSASPSVERTDSRSVPSIPLLIVPLIFLGLLLVIFSLKQFREPSNAMQMVVGLTALGIFSYGLVLCPFLVRSYGKKVNFSDFLTWISKRITGRRALVATTVFLLLAIFLGAMWPLGYVVECVSRSWLDKPLIETENPTIAQLVGLGFGSFMVLFYSLAIPFAAKTLYKRRIHVKDWEKRLEIFKASQISGLDILYSARNADELNYWLRSDYSLFNNTQLIRSFSSFVLNAARMVKYSEHQISRISSPICLSADEFASFKLRRVRQVLEDRYKIASSC